MPANTTSEQTLGISQSLYDMAVAIGDYRVRGLTSVPPLPHPDSMILGGYQRQLLTLSDDFATQAVAVMLANIKADLNAISEATQQARQVIARVKLVKNIIAVTTAIIEIGTAVIAKDPLLIAQKAAAAFKIAQEALPHPQEDAAG